MKLTRRQLVGEVLVLVTILAATALVPLLSGNTPNLTTLALVAVLWIPGRAAILWLRPRSKNEWLAKHW